MDEYTGDLFVEFYDLLHAHNQDADILCTILRPFGKKVLELGCGTGRIAIPLAKAGYEVTGIELSRDMAQRLSQKEYPKNRLKVVLGDARKVTLEEKFDIVLIDCNFLTEFINSADVLAILKNSKQHLRPGGVVVIDASIPEALYLKGGTGFNIKEDFPTSRGTIIRDYFSAQFDLLNQIETNDILLEEWVGETLLRSASSHQKRTWYLPREIRALVREAGMTLVKETGDLLDEEGTTPISLEKGAMVFYCS